MRLLCAVLIATCLAGVFGEDEEEVTAVLERFNCLIRQEGRDALEGDLKQQVPGLVALEVAGKLGDFDTLRVVDHRASIIRAEKDGVRTFTYDVALGLQNLQLISGLSLKTPLFNTSLNLLVSLEGESLRLIGEITKSADGGCQATLSSAYVQSVGDVLVHVSDEQGQDVMPQGFYTLVKDLYPFYQPVAQTLVDFYLKPTLESRRTSQLICQYYSPL